MIRKKNIEIHQFELIKVDDYYSYQTGIQNIIFLEFKGITKIKF